MTSLKDLIEHELLFPGEQLESRSPTWPARASLTADGSVLYDESSYRTPSAAAKAVRRGGATNGWSFWYVQRDSEAVPLAALRSAYEEPGGAPGRPRPGAARKTGAQARPVRDADPNRADPEDEQTQAGAPDAHHDDAGLITAFGMFWRRDLVDWSVSSTAVRVLGRQSQDEKVIDFAQQIGVYLLHDGARTIYTGRVSSPRLGARLAEHTKDRVSGRWDRFSWFGLRPVLSTGVLGAAGSNFGTDLVVATMEAILIEGLEPPQNRRQGDGMTGQEYTQAEDPSLQEQDLMATLLKQLQSRRR